MAEGASPKGNMPPDAPDRDPVTSQSLSRLLLISALLLVAALGWALYDEFFGLRPWKNYQTDFVRRYTAFLRKQKPKQEAAEKAIKASPEYQALQQQLDSLQRSVQPQLHELDEQAALVDERLAVITLKYTDAHAHVTDMIWRVEHSSGGAKKSWQSDLDGFKKGPFQYEAVSLDNGKSKAESVNYDYLEGEFKALQAKKGELLVRKGEILRPVSELRAKQDSYFQQHLNGLTSEQIQGLIDKTRTMDVAIKQINIPDAGVVDRCESCHLGIREPIQITAKDMGGERAFVSHPDPELLRIHDPDKFGCTPCHNGNGMQLDSVEQAHGDNAPDNEAARKFYAQANDLRLEVSKIDLQTDQLKTRIKFLLMDRKKVGPDLKEVRAKLRPEWVPVWLKNPHAFRPATRMPRFRLDEDELPAVAAFIWQSGLDVKAPSQPPGDPVKGKESFESRGRIGSHAVGDGANAVGGWFGANLSRMGEKVNYDYLVRWIHNPRERSAPYCPVEKRDLTPEDYKKHNLAYVFDIDHSKCPNDGQELMVEQMTPMPNLRLSWEESRDVASYLMTLK